jgi:hypothetical protein
MDRSFRVGACYQRCKKNAFDCCPAANIVLEPTLRHERRVMIATVPLSHIGVPEVGAAAISPNLALPIQSRFSHTCKPPTRLPELLCSDRERSVNLAYFLLPKYFPMIPDLQPKTPPTDSQGSTEVGYPASGTSLSPNSARHDGIRHETSSGSQHRN